MVRLVNDEDWPVSLKWRIAVAMALISSLATVTFAVASFRSTRDRLYAEVDQSLVDLDPLLSGRRVGADAFPDGGQFGGYFTQVATTDGTVIQSTFAIPIALRAVAASNRRGVAVSSFQTVEADGVEYRVRSTAFDRGTVSIGRSLGETNRVLRSLRNRSILLIALVAALAGGAGIWISTRVTASLRRLTDAADSVASTGRPAAAFKALGPDAFPDGGDEVGRLGAGFDRMLRALVRSEQDQQRLVEDAGHELRTPLTSIRTNLDMLRRYPSMDVTDRDAIIDDLRAETAELTGLVNEIVSVAAGEATDEEFTSFDLGDLVQSVADRYHRRTGRVIDVTVDGGAGRSMVTAQRSNVQRAVSSLLDNAQKFDPSESDIEVSVRATRVTVADRGPGLSPEETDRVFERFHRSAAARSVPGSGLGLAIVREVARRHGGDAEAVNRPGGGAAVSFWVGEGSERDGLALDGDGPYRFGV